MSGTFAFAKEKKRDDPERVSVKSALKKKEKSIPVDDEMQFGDVCTGWTSIAWGRELRRKALACEDLHPKTADLYRRWADEIEKREPIIEDFLPKLCSECGGVVGYEDYEPDLCYGCFNLTQERVSVDDYDRFVVEERAELDL